MAKEFVNKLACTFVNNVGAYSNYSARARARTRSHDVATKESDWLIYGRAFLLLCCVTEEVKFSVAKQKELDSALFAGEGKTFV